MGGNGDVGGGKMPDCPGEGPAVELVPGVEVDEDAGRAGAVDDAGLELGRVGDERGKVPDPGSGVVTSGAPPTMLVLPWVTGVGVTSGAACEPAAKPPNGGRALTLAKAAASSAWRCSSISLSMRLSRAWA